MGLFNKFNEIIKQNKVTDISKMEFKRFTGLAGSVPQMFADNSFPICPICKQSSPWMLHISTKIVKAFPIQKYDHTYHVKCEHCGMVMHTVIHKIGENMPHEVTSPSPRNNITMMTIDVVGDKAENFDLAGKEMSIWELNQLAERK